MRGDAAFDPCDHFLLSTSKSFSRTRLALLALIGDRSTKAQWKSWSLSHVSRLPKFQTSNLSHESRRYARDNTSMCIQMIFDDDDGKGSYFRFSISPENLPSVCPILSQSQVAIIQVHSSLWKEKLENVLYQNLSQSLKSS